MAVKLKPLRDQIIVLTGASSGIGLSTARMAAKRGAKLVVSARNEGALQKLTEEIRSQGGQAEYCVADVGDEQAVHQIGTKAIERFGGFDTWVNNAGVGLYGKLCEVSRDDHRRRFETNFWGTVYGSQAAAKHLRTRGGAIINVGSEVSDRALPILGMYAASKHAVKGFTDALRMELEMEKAPISVTLIKPAATDTPLAEHAKNYMDEEPALPAPLYSPEIVAKVILHCAEYPERDMFAGGTAKLHSLQEKLMPRLTDWFMERSLPPKMRSGRPANHADDALYQPATGLQKRGQSPGRRRESSVDVAATLHPLFSTLALIGAGVAAAALFGASMKPANNESASS